MINCHTKTCVTNLIHFQNEMFHLFFLQKDAPKKLLKISTHLVCHAVEELAVEAVISDKNIMMADILIQILQ